MNVHDENAGRYITVVLVSSFAERFLQLCGKILHNKVELSKMKTILCHIYANYLYLYYKMSKFL